MIKWKKATTWLVLAFVVVFIAVRCQESKADTIFELIPATAFIAGKHYTGAGISITERFADRYDVAAILMTEQHCDCKRGNAVGNLGVHAQRIVQWKRLELGLGAAYWQNQTPAWSSNTTFALSWGLNFGNVGIRHRHYSTGGASDRNGGLDLLTIGYRFE
jgi:hypothetical protein